MELIKSLRNKLITIVSDAVDGKVKGKELGMKLDAELDKKVGDKTSEYVQRGLITNTLIEILQGLWHESPDGLANRFALEAHNLRQKWD